MRNILLRLEYDGTNYFGWQIQSEKKSHDTRHTTHVKKEKTKTVQGELEKALRKLFGQYVKLTYASRTDRGVHACDQVALVSLETNIPPDNIKRALNSFLPSDIRINDVAEVSCSFHPRYDVKSKMYRYRILNAKEDSVFERHASWFVPDELDVENMRRAAVFLTGYKDYSLFAKEAHTYHDCRRTVYRIGVKKTRSLIIVEIEADGFLRNMVRNIVTLLMQVGRGDITPSQVRAIMGRKKIWKKNPAPPHGLYLHRVKYGRIPYKKEKTIEK